MIIILKNNSWNTSRYGLIDLKLWIKLPGNWFSCLLYFFHYLNVMKFTPLIFWHREMNYFFTCTITFVFFIYIKGWKTFTPNLWFYSVCHLLPMRCIERSCKISWFRFQHLLSVWMYKSCSNFYFCLLVTYFCQIYLGRIGGYEYELVFLFILWIVWMD